MFIVVKIMECLIHLVVQPETHCSYAKHFDKTTCRTENILHCSRSINTRLSDLYKFWLQVERKEENLIKTLNMLANKTLHAVIVNMDNI